MGKELAQKDLDSLQRLTDRIHRMRSLLGDHDNVPQLIIRKRGANSEVFRKRVETLRRLEIKRANLVAKLTQL